MPTSHSSNLPKDKLVDLYRQALMADIPLERVEEHITTYLVRERTANSIEIEDDQQQVDRLRQSKPWINRVFAAIAPFLFIGIGVVLVSTAAWPIVEYYLITAPKLRTVSLLSPLPQTQVLEGMPQIITQAQASEAETTNAESNPESSDNLKIIKEELDYTNLANWFGQTSLPQVEEGPTTEYVIDIPQVDIEGAVVKIGGANLDKSLIQYPGTAMPGEPGSPVIFGHSVLRQFYSPSLKNPRRYVSIFSKIMTLKKGDKIYVTQDNIKYTYAVKEKTVVKPEDTFILDQRYDARQLKLVTCVPEGTYLERGVITAELVKE